MPDSTNRMTFSAAMAEDARLARYAEEAMEQRRENKRLREALKECKAEIDNNIDREVPTGVHPKWDEDIGGERMRYSVSNSEAVERAIGRLWHYEQSLGSVMSDGRTVKAALDELQEKVDEQSAYIEQLERSYSSMMRSLDEVEAEAKGT